MVLIWRWFEMSWNLDKKHKHHVCSLFTLGGREGVPGPEAVPTYQGLSPNPTWSRDGRLVQTIACHKYRITPNDLSPESSWCQLQLQTPIAWLGHWLFACVFDIIHQHDNAQNNTPLPFDVLCGRLLDEHSSELSHVMSKKEILPQNLFGISQNSFAKWGDQLKCALV